MLTDQRLGTIMTRPADHDDQPPLACAIEFSLRVVCVVEDTQPRSEGSPIQRTNDPVPPRTTFPVITTRRSCSVTWRRSNGSGLAPRRLSHLARSVHRGAMTLQLMFGEQMWEQRSSRFFGREVSTPWLEVVAVQVVECATEGGKLPFEFLHGRCRLI